jgi:hypothetical protein
LSKVELFQPDDVVVVTSDEGEKDMTFVRSRIGNYAILANGIKFHVLDDKRKSLGCWFHEPTATKIEPIAK